MADQSVELAKNVTSLAMEAAALKPRVPVLQAQAEGAGLLASRVPDSMRRSLEHAVSSGQLLEEVTTAAEKAEAKGLEGDQVQLAACYAVLRLWVDRVGEALAGEQRALSAQGAQAQGALSVVERQLRVLAPMVQALRAPAVEAAVEEEAAVEAMPEEEPNVDREN